MKPEVHFADDQALPVTLIARPDVFDYLMQLPGQVYRAVATRETVKVRIGEHYYFIKRHRGVGWLELIKNWLIGKRPVVSADNEVRAIQALNALGIPTTPYVAHGIRGRNPATLDSFVMTKDLGDIVTLEEVALMWSQQAIKLSQKRAWIRQVATIAQVLHAHGIYHRDFYLCHFCLNRTELAFRSPTLHVMDLHRAEIHPHGHADMQRKDLAALYFSAMDLPLNRGDRWTFMRTYAPELDWKKTAVQGFWRKVADRAAQLYTKFQRKQSAGIKL